MSTEQSLDPQLIEQTKQQIRSLVNEIAQLAKSEVAPPEFYGEFLPRVVSALAAVGGVVWTLEPEGRLSIGYQINLQETQLRERQEDQVRHGRLIQKVLASGEGMLVPPHSGTGEDDEAANTTGFLLVFGAIKTDLETVGVVEVFQRPDTGPSTQKGYLRFLLQMCELAGDYFKSRQLRNFSDRQVLWSQLEEFTRMVHASLDPRETAYTVANEGRRLIECDRVSVAIRRGKKCYVEAISGQDLFDKRSNTVKLLNRLSTAVVASDENMWYLGDTSNMAPQVEEAVQEYVDESHTKMLAVLPLRRSRREEEHEDEDRREASEPPIGALIVEQIEDVRVAEKLRQRVEVVSRHSATALTNALEHNSLFLMPVWRTIGKTRWLVKARTLPKTLLVTVAIVAALVALFTVRADFKLNCKGTLEPEFRREVFAEVDGTVEEVLVKQNEIVKKDQLLVRMRNTDLEKELIRVKGEIAVTGQQMLNRGRSISENRGMREDELNQLRTEQVELRAKLNSLDVQRQLCEQKMKYLEIHSPIDGQVVTWDLNNLLKNRPVQRGQVLMRVADLNGPWRLELHMPENRMGHIVRERNSLKQNEPAKDLNVEYILAIDPGTTREGTVQDIHGSADVRGEEGNVVLVNVTIDTEKLRGEVTGIRPGASVTGKVDCGRRAIGYVWFHDAIDYVQSRIIFPWF
jgi:multidrug efflux pump subunit AcrA (membrane-fusion protein)